MKILSYGVPVTQYYERNTIQPPALKEGDKWYCPNCHGDLFGVFHDGSLHIKYKDRNLIAQGIVMVTCRLCGVVSRISTTNMPITLDVMTIDDLLNPNRDDSDDGRGATQATAPIVEEVPRVVEQEPQSEEPVAEEEISVVLPKSEIVVEEHKPKRRGRPPTKHAT